MNLATLKQLFPRSAVVVLMLAGVASVVFLSIPRPTALALAREGGWVENASAGVFAVSALVAAVSMARRFNSARLAALVMLVWAFFRELDFQKKFTYRSVESLGFYTRPIAPWEEKLVAFLILSFFAVAGLRLLWELKAHLRPALAQGRAWVGYLFNAVLLGVIASFSEKVLKQTLVEEVCELGLAVQVLLMTCSLLPKTPVAAVASSGRSEPVSRSS